MSTLLDWDATDLVQAIRRGECSAVEATRVYLGRIQAFHDRLHAVITVNDQALAQAQALDALPATQRGPLHGLPLLIKDNIDVAGLPTTAGSWLMRHHSPAADAPLIARLRAAGAVILGKANMTEWANFMTLGMKNGYSSLGGQTANPWNTELDTGGSSSGSGVGVAARLCAAAIGTETSGSIISPAQQNGVVGLKPTLGLVPRTGIVPISHSQDTAGPITRSPRDAALILSVIAGPDERDPASQNVFAGNFNPSAETLNSARIGLISDAEDLSEAEEYALSAAREALERAGAHVQEVVFPSRAELKADYWQLETFTVLEYEFKGDLNAYLDGVQNGPHNLREVIEGNDLHAERCLKYGQTLLHAAQGTRGDHSERAYALARARDLMQCRERGFNVLFHSGLDAVLLPGMRGYAWAAKAGYPSLTLPAFQGAKPAGVVLVGRPAQDMALLALTGELLPLLGGVRFPNL